MANAAAAVLRPLTPAETRAVELHGLDVPTAAITAQTRLTADQIGVALARQAEWDALRNGTSRRNARVPKARGASPADAGTTPIVPPGDGWDEVLPRPASDQTAAPEPAAEPEPADSDTEPPGTPGEGVAPAEAEPEPVAAPAAAAGAQWWQTRGACRYCGCDVLEDRPFETVGNGVAHLTCNQRVQLAAAEAAERRTSTETAAPADGLQALIDDAERSPQPRARQLAARIRADLEELRAIVQNDSKVRVLAASAEVLRRQLAQTETELAELLGTAAAAQPAEPEPEVSVDEAAPAETPAPNRPSAAAAPAHSRKVREWARAEGWDVAERGQISAAINLAYQKAHPDQRA